MRTSSGLKRLLDQVSDTLGIHPASGDATMFTQWLLSRPGFNMERAQDVKWVGAKFKQWRRSRRGKYGASDRSAVIRLALTMPKGSAERRTLLSTLSGTKK